MEEIKDAKEEISNKQEQEGLDEEVNIPSLFKEEIDTSVIKIVC